jgi:hypothetical protein
LRNSLSQTLATGNRQPATGFAGHLTAYVSPRHPSCRFKLSGHTFFIICDNLPPCPMFARIVVDNTGFEEHPQVLQDVRSLSKQVQSADDKTVIEPKNGYLIPILMLLHRTEIEYQIQYDTAEFQIRKSIHEENH